MIETINELVTFTVFGSAVWFLVLVAALIVTLFISEYQEEGGVGFVAVVVFVIVSSVWGTVPLMDLVTIPSVVGYLLIGFLYSLARTYFKGKELTEDAMEVYDNRGSLHEDETIEDYIKRQKSRFELKEHVFRWWLMFPISMLHWLFGTLLKDVFTGVYSKIEFLYDKLLNA